MKWQILQFGSDFVLICIEKKKRKVCGRFTREMFWSVLKSFADNNKHISKWDESIFQKFLSGFSFPFFAQKK